MGLNILSMYIPLLHHVTMPEIWFSKNVLRYLNYAKLAPALEKVEEHAPATVINKMQHVANLLGAIDIFQDLSVPDLDLLANLAQLKSLSAGIVVAQGGEIANSLFLVIEGLLEPEDWRKKILRTRLLNL